VAVDRLVEADIHHMLSLEPDERNRVLVFASYASGARRGELAGLCWRHLQPSGDAGQITVFWEGGKTRSIQCRIRLERTVASLKIRRNAVSSAGLF
jgi:site-specific recombinase XerC